MASELLEWRVVLMPSDDFDPLPPLEEQASMLEGCVEEFRRRLIEERNKGMVIMGFGPIVKEGKK